MSPATAAYIERKTRRDPDGCLRWTSLDAHGYGRAYVGSKPVLAHRLVWEATHGPLVDGLDLDHLCHDADRCRAGRSCPHRACVDLTHLDPVTRRQNNDRAKRQRTRCRRGHPYSGTERVDGTGNRLCRRCAADRAAAYRQRRAAQVAA